MLEFGSKMGVGVEGQDRPQGVQEVHHAILPTSVYIQILHDEV